MSPQALVLDMAECRATYDMLIQLDGSAILRAMGGALLKLSRGVS